MNKSCACSTLRSSFRKAQQGPQTEPFVAFWCFVFFFCFFWCELFCCHRLLPSFRWKTWKHLHWSTALRRPVKPAHRSLLRRPLLNRQRQLHRPTHQPVPRLPRRATKRRLLRQKKSRKVSKNFHGSFLGRLLLTLCGHSILEYV